MMRNLLLPFLLFAVSGTYAQSELKEELSQLDVAIAHRDSYIASREQRIESLKNVLRQSNFSAEQSYVLNQQLIEEYMPYQADSTIDYLYRNIKLAQRMHDISRINESRIKLAYLYSTAGIYLEAANTLSQIDTTLLDHKQLVDYYVTRHKLNDELQLYSHDSEQEALSVRLTALYARLIIENTPEDSNIHMNFVLWQAVRNRDLKNAAMLAEKLCSRLPVLSREYATAAYMRALVADMMLDTPTGQIWYARAAKTDMQMAIRDNAALKSLANTLLDDENIQRAMRYMNVVMDDARFFNSRLRPWQDALTLHVIEQAYQQRRQRMDRLSNVFTVSMIVFLVLVVVGAVFVLLQNHRLNFAKRELMQAYDRLNGSNDNLKEINTQLVALNSQISEANEVKEEYIGIFLTLCSEYIDRLAEGRHHVKRMLRDGRIEEMKKEFASSDSDDRDLEEFYRIFDTTFLQLYPTFIEEFNSLIDPEVRIEPKKGELLTTELRLFALIRLGVSDSSKIAALLRYSVSTIYNYRSKIKAHTLISKDEFEERIRTIGAFNTHQRSKA